MKTLILCNGLSPSGGLFRECRKQADYFIAADGGGNIARSFNSLPDIVIGDLDSFESHTKDSFQVILDKNQETNDLEKALSLARQKKAKEVTVLGATGKRLDHSLKNLSVLKQFNGAFDRLLFRDNFGDTLLLSPLTRIELPAGTTVSLFPLSGIVTGIKTKGLKYVLSDEALENGVRDGSSNEVISNPVEISYEKGDLLLFIVSQA